MSHGTEPLWRRLWNRRPVRTTLLVVWYLGLLALILMLHDLPSREFRYWRM